MGQDSKVCDCDRAQVEFYPDVPSYNVINETIYTGTGNYVNENYGSNQSKDETMGYPPMGEYEQLW